MKANTSAESASEQDPFFSPAPKNMKTLLRHIRETYGGIPEYLRECGVSEELMEKLKNRLLGKEENA